MFKKKLSCQYTLLGQLFCNPHRILKCRKSYFSLNIVGMPYPGLPVNLKLHLWHTICRLILTFELETVYFNRATYGKLESLQGTIVKAFIGLSRYSLLLQAGDGSWYLTY